MNDFERVTDAADFDEAVNGSDLVVAKFQTKECVVCRRLVPGLKQMTDSVAEPVRVVEIDAAESIDLAERCEIRSVPTLILYRAGSELTRCNGFQSVGMLREWMAPHLRA